MSARQQQAHDSNRHTTGARQQQPHDINTTNKTHDNNKRMTHPTRHTTATRH